MMSGKQSANNNGISLHNEADIERLSFTGTSFATNPLQTEVETLKQQLENKETELTDLTNRHQQAINDRESMEGQLMAMKEKVQEADNKLSEVKAESEAVIRQNESDQQELAMIRRRSLVGGGGQIITQMYETILMRYEKLNTSHEELRRKMNEEAEKKMKLQKQLESSRANDAGPERESLVRRLQFMNENVDALQRDLSRVREERTLFKREYSLVMSERDAVHKEMDKLQDDITQRRKENEQMKAETVKLLEEKEQLRNQVMTLQQGSTNSVDAIAMRQELYAAQRERKQALLEKEAKINEAYAAHRAHTIAMETIEKMSRERDSLRSNIELSTQQLNEALLEAKAATRWRELAFSERDKLRHELEESRRVCDVMTEERERLVKQLEEAVKEHDTTKETKNKILVELRDMQTRADMSQRENTHSHDSAIDAGEWESDPIVNLYKQHQIVRLLPQEHDIAIEQGFFVKYSNSPGISGGDRILAMNDMPVSNKTNYELNEMLTCHNVCTLQLVKYAPSFRDESAISSRDEMMESLHGEYGVSPPRQRRHENNAWAGSGVRLRSKSGRVHGNVSGHDQTDAVMLTRQNDVIISKKIGNRDSTLLYSEEESQVSESTAYSDPSHGGIKKDGYHVGESPAYPLSGKKKKKISSTLFLWNRKKKAKSVVGTSSTGGSTGGTWPRLDSPSLSNVLAAGGGRLSVFVKNRTRPTITPNTFTPPGGHSAGHTPPTVIRGQPSMSHASPNSSYNATTHSHSPQGGSLTSATQSPQEQVSTHRSKLRPSHASEKRKRPLSAPMGEHCIAYWQHHTGNNNNVAPTTNASLQKDPDISIGRKSPPLPHERSFISTSSTASQLYNQPTVVVSSEPSQPQAFSRNRLHLFYHRQQSMPDSTPKSLALALPTSMSSSMNSSTTSYASSASSRPRSAYSLPRPSSASRGPTNSVSSHTSSDSRKSRTLDCKRIRLPSEASVGMKLSGSERGSTTLSSERSNPLLFNPLHSLDSTIVVGGSNATTPQTDASISSLSVESNTSSRSRKPPVSNDPRFVTMIKGSEPIGISIVSGGESGGIFVSRLTERSLASKAGLEYGDQLLEYNGVNLRNAKEEQARVIMSQTQPGDNIKFLAQYNLEKYKHSIESNLSDTLGISQPLPDGNPVLYEERDERTITPDATPRASPHVEETLRSQRINEPRYIFMSGGCSHVKLVGGNSFGIYVASAQSNDDTLTATSLDLRTGDKILEFNRVRFDNITLENASMLLSQTISSSSLCVMYEPNKYKQIYGEPGDHFYVRALFDHMVEKEGALRFARNSILLVENTFPDYVTGQWVASLVDEQGVRSTRGRIPSKVTVEKDRDNCAHTLDDASSCTGSTSGKRLSGSGRRSFFKRKKPHRTSSRSSGDVRLHKSPSENSIESTTDGATEHFGAYQVVEKHSSNIRRPVIIFGPHSSLVVERLTREHTQLFVKCCISSMKGIDHESGIIETYTHGSETRVLTGDLLRATMAQFPERHVLLELSVEAIDRLHAIRVYPIIAFIKYSSAKKIKESQDKVASREKISMKQCKDILERQSSVERTLMSKYYGTVSINGGAAVTVANKVSKVVSHEHMKVLWLPTKSKLLNY